MPAKRLVSDQLRQAVLNCGKTRYRISKETGISESLLSRFMNQGIGLSLANIDKLCECIGARIVLDRDTSAIKRAKRRTLKKVKKKRQLKHG